MGASVILNADSIAHGYYIAIEGMNNMGELNNWLKQSLYIRSSYIVLRKSEHLLVLSFASTEKEEAIEYLNSIRIDKYNFVLIQL